MPRYWLPDNRCPLAETDPDLAVEQPPTRPATPQDLSVFDWPDPSPKRSPAPPTQACSESAEPEDEPPDECAEESREEPPGIPSTKASAQQPKEAEPVEQLLPSPNVPPPMSMLAHPSRKVPTTATTPASPASSSASSPPQPPPKTLREMLERRCPLFTVCDATTQLLHAAATWPGCVAIIDVVQSRSHEVDQAAATRGAGMIATLAGRAGAEECIRWAFEHVLEGLGRCAADTPTTAAGRGGQQQRGGASAKGQAMQQLALRSLLERSVAAGGRLQRIVASAVAEHVTRDGADYEEQAASLLVCAGGGPDEMLRTAKEQGLLAALSSILASCADAKQRLRALACCTNLWERAVARWPARLECRRDECTPEARRLAAYLINVAVNTALYDSTAKARLHATKLLGLLALPLDKREVLKLAMLKVRDKDKEVRKAAFHVLAAISGSEGVADRLNALQVRVYACVRSRRHVSCLQLSCSPVSCRHLCTRAGAAGRAAWSSLERIAGAAAAGSPDVLGLFPRSTGVRAATRGGC